MALLQYMYINKSNKLSYIERFKIAKLFTHCRNVSYIAKRFNISRQAVYKIKKKFNKEGVHGLEDRKPGPLKEPLNSKFYDKVIDYRKLTNAGACKMEKHFGELGFKVSHNKINEVLRFEDMINKKKGKKKKPNWIRYRADRSNKQWHIDWSFDHITRKPMLGILDDYSRYVVFADVFDEENAENSAYGLRKAILKYGWPEELVIDNHAVFKNIHTKATPNDIFGKVLTEFGIKPIFITPHHPQSNGKMERWFGSYKIETKYIQVPNISLRWYVDFYNNKRLHQALDYKTPAQVYVCKLNSG